MDEPPESSIVEVCDFASLDPFADRQLVIAALKAKNGSVQDVVLAFYDDPTKFRQTYTWDESPFLGDREGTNDNPNVPSFNIQTPDESTVIHGVSPSGAYHHQSVPPSRPPSRAQSPLSKMTEWTTNGFDGSTGPATATMSQEDKDMERALAESAAMVGQHTPQETGITSAGNTESTIGVAHASTPTSVAAFAPPQMGASNSPHFGPANRPSYDHNEWAMTRIIAHPQEPGPHARSRAPGAPAFLRSQLSEKANELPPSQQQEGGKNTGNCSLNALLTILHSIPAARNALLATGVPPTTYGQNFEWWKGSQIDPIGEIDSDAESDAGSANASATRDPDDVAVVTPVPITAKPSRAFIEEVHRLMAFLDNTDRAYGTVDNLKETYLMDLALDRDDSRSFFNTLNNFHLRGLSETFFTCVKMLRIHKMSTEYMTDFYGMLDLNVNGRHETTQKITLYDVLDTMYWADMMKDEVNGTDDIEADPEYRIAVIKRPAPVHIFHLNANGGNSDNGSFPSIQIPQVFYADRYLDENKEWALGLQKKIRHVLNAIAKLKKKKERKLYYDDRTSGNGIVHRRERTTLSEQALNYAMQKLWQYQSYLLWSRLEATGHPIPGPGPMPEPGDDDFNLAVIERVQPETPSEVAMFDTLKAEIAVHRRELVRIRRTVKKFDKEMQALEALATRLRSSEPIRGDDKAWSPSHATYLRGVIINSNKFYMCRRERVSLEPVGGSEAEATYDDSESGYIDQWWQIIYRQYDAEPISIEKSTVGAAQADAFESQGQAILVYCTDEAWAAENAPLSDALRTFVRFDNRFFKQEKMSEASAPSGARAGGEHSERTLEYEQLERKRQPVEDASPISPLKRRQQRSGSVNSVNSINTVESMASNMASAGGDELSDREMEDVPLLLDGPYSTDDSRVGKRDYTWGGGGGREEMVGEGGGVGGGGGNQGTVDLFDYKNFSEFNTNDEDEEEEEEDEDVKAAITASLAEMRGQTSSSPSQPPAVTWQPQQPVLPQQQKATAEHVEEVAVVEHLEQPQGQPRENSPLGKEMVQLAISNAEQQGGSAGGVVAGDAAINGTAAVVGASTACHSDGDKGNMTGLNGNENGAQQANGITAISLPATTLANQMQEQPKAHPQILKPQPRPKPSTLKGKQRELTDQKQQQDKSRSVQLIADWDNPEGRYVHESEDIEML